MHSLNSFFCIFALRRNKCHSMNTTKIIPYGIADFVSLRNRNAYYVDKTPYIEKLEQTSYVLFLRPRRYGKSLFVNMLAAYYDVAYANNFNTLFGDLYIGQHPTPEQGKYLILKITFSDVHATKNGVQDSFNDVVFQAIRSFVNKYSPLLPAHAIQEINDCNGMCDTALRRLKNLVSQTNKQLYIMLDEYDNFANTLLESDETTYLAVMHSDGFIRYFYNILKNCVSDNDSAVARIFITGVSPLMLSDVTSGFNIADNISVSPSFNEMIGFTEDDVLQMLTYYHDATNLFSHTPSQLIEIIKPYYNNNCFSYLSAERNTRKMYNPDMVLYFLKEYLRNEGTLPQNMIDDNISTDFNKIQKLIRYEKTFSTRNKILQEIMLSEQYDCSQFKTSFNLQDITNPDNLVSLLFYMGLLSYGKNSHDEVQFIIPNIVIRQQYFSYLKKSYDEYLGWTIDPNEQTTLWRNFAYHGEWQPLIQRIAKTLSDNSSARDFDTYGESFVRGFIVSQLCCTNNFLAQTEQPLAHGYIDIILRPIAPQYKHALLIELKYCRLHAPEQDADAKLAEAITQLQQYASDATLTKEATKKGWTLHPIALVFRGWQIVRSTESLTISFRAD